MDLEAERILFQDLVNVKKAAEALTKPLPRLSAEIAWLPVKNSTHADAICKILESSEGHLSAKDRLKRVQDFLEADELMPVAKGNVLAAGLSRLPRHTSDEVAAWILEIAQASDDIDTEKLRAVINADRKVAGFPTAKLPHIETEIQNLRDHYRQVMTSALDNLSADERAEGMTLLVEPATDDEKPLPRLIDRLVDWYELDAQKSLEEHETKIRELDEKLRLAADENHSDSTLIPLVSQLIDAVNNWHTIAQPIQINKKIKGLLHEDSRRVAWRVRDLAIHLFNDYNKLSFCQKLIAILQAVFADVVEVSEALAKDIRQLEEITGVPTPDVPNPTARRRERRARRVIEVRVQKLRELCATPDSDMDYILILAINSLIQPVKNWKVLAQTTKAHHADYCNVANLVRELALYIWKQYSEPDSYRQLPEIIREEFAEIRDSARQLLEMLQEEFAEIRDIAALIVEDLKALEAPERARIEVQVQVEKLRTAADAKKPDSNLSPKVSQVIQSVKEWKTLTQTFHSYRRDHYNVANLVRELARHLWHEHGKIDHTRKLMKMLQEEFAEISEITRLVAEDIKALDATENARLRIQTQAEKLRAAAAAKNSDSILGPKVNQLVQSVKDWKTLAQPFEAYFSDYYNVANLMRDIALHLWNEHAKRDLSRELLKMLQKEFAQLDKITPLIAEDINALEAPERAHLDVQAQAEKLRAAVDAKKPESILSPLVAQLIKSVKEWKTLAQPFKAYFADYYNVANLVRELAFHLRHDHDKLNSSHRSSELLQELSTEVVEIATLIREEANFLHDINEENVRPVAKEPANPPEGMIEAILIGILFTVLLVVLGHYL